MKPSLKNTIKVERARKGFTQADLAEKVGVTRLTIHSIEVGKFNPSVMLALKIADCFGTKVEELFELENDD
ncbi:MAG: helix-turn-helix transcriptional regulator [Bacteroidales bacterium]|nr:helix-turn-helix transcriptional regulator [Bacteroidales bacterium]